VSAEAASTPTALPKRPLGSVYAVVITIVLIVLAVMQGSSQLTVILPLIALIPLSVMFGRSLLVWRNLLILMILVILFIPIRRYSLPGNLPFQMEPYRLLVALIIAGWASSLLIDPSVRFRRTGYEGPIGLFLFAVAASLATNPGRLVGVQTYALKQMTFFVSFLLVFYLVVSVVRSRWEVDTLIRVLVAGGGILGLTTVWEARSHYNIYNHLSTVMPVLRVEVVPWVGQDGRGDRAYGSAQHAIPLGAALIMLLPLAVYLIHEAKRRRWFWIACAGAVTMGSLATYSRTSVLMLLVMIVMYFRLRPRQMRRFWPALIPAVLLIHFAVPGTIGTLKNSFFPEGGLIAQQDAGAGTAGSGRLADLGPGLRQWADQPFVGQGFGTRIVDGPQANSGILDDQWLGTLLETGIVGVLGWAWLLIRAVRRLNRAARADESARGWLFAGLSASICAYGFSMLTYDAFAFIQVTFLLFFLLSFAAVLLPPAERRAFASGHRRAVFPAR
jgi:hypothetical protein